MNLLRIFHRKPKFKEPPLSVSVRNALRVCVDGMEPGVSPEEFESLYRDVLDAEVHGRDVTPIIINFEKQRR